jgi:3-oxoacyl-[acyl-carrier-protein] synthase II
MLCGGADEFHALTAATFDIIQAASTQYNDRPQCTPRPFDRDRDGIVCSEGAGVLCGIAGFCRARGADILAEISGFASTSDSSSIANPDPNPFGFAWISRLRNQA